ncbi:Glutamate synthase [NADPH] large chain precursor [Sporomusa ovata DSM 2662]|uniref:Ferredoxin-dependent glutamate synthase n=1 Tax=Sporomusa ovata TaxID=2378 RepID=A0A0U1L2A3_9FIRM|nr:glutamate synthase-related protein [Sporomusa ovata]EQB25228.1 ferredoxin-dependent glutamate synthase [Sporomusa ovata DSM 2662]CQR73791.1 Ferredoxin-dependent glutamate synthase [Sporomusa ovata]
MLQNYQKTLQPQSNATAVDVFSKEYVDNPFLLVTIGEKLTSRAIVEATMRAQTGKRLQRPFGSPLNLSPWHQLLLNPRQLFHLPTPSISQITTQTVIGPNCKKPLILDIPIMITGMSYGGSLSLPMKIALAQGAALAGTSTNTGESAVTGEERSAAKFLIGQYNRGGWLSSNEQLQQLDAIEVQLGQGAWGGAVEDQVGHQKDEHLTEAWHLNSGENATIYPRMPGCNSPQDYIKLINNLKSEYDVPIGVKIAGTDFIELELAVITQTTADFIVIDGAEGGTSSSPPTLQDDVGLPTLFALDRTIKWLQSRSLRHRFSVIITGGMTTPGHFLKALALGADAVYIGSIAVIAALQTQMANLLPNIPPSQLAFYVGKQKDILDVPAAANHLYNFLMSCTEEMKLVIQALGKTSTKGLNRDDLIAIDRDLANTIEIRYAGDIRKEQNAGFYPPSSGADDVAFPLQQ